MINKKIFLSFLMLFVFSLIAYADGKSKNFITILNGTSIVTSGDTKNYSFVGQPVVFDTKEDNGKVSQSAFASVFYSVQSEGISFTNNTGSEPFDKVDVDLKVTIDATDANSGIETIQYRIWQGPNPDWNDWENGKVYDYGDFSKGATVVNLSTTAVFSAGENVNFFRVYAQLQNGSKRWSGDYIVNISSKTTGTVQIVAPDKISKTATVDPQVESTPYSISLTSTTITLLEGDESSKTVVYSVTVSSSTDGNKYGLYKDGKIIYTHSKFADSYNKDDPDVLVPVKLKKNTTYTLVMESQNNDSGKINSDTVTFKTLSGGVADILTYPSPFNPKKEKIKIRYLLAKDSNVTIKIYDKAGKIVSKIIQSEFRPAGTNEEEWDGRNYAGSTLATGAYIVEIIANGDRRYTALAIVGK